MKRLLIIGARDNPYKSSWIYHGKKRWCDSWINEFCYFCIGPIVFMGTLNAFFIYYISEILFMTLHLIGNTLGFIFILPGLIQVIYKILKQT
ncbi:MAG: hypothetical protein ACTSU4_03535 [Promethearchaeota archaeon]